MIEEIKMNNNNLNPKNVGVGYIINKAALYIKVTVLQMFKEKKFEVTPEQYGLLFFLSKNDGMYQRQLAKISLKDRPNITRLIDILENKGFVYREIDPNNRRIFKVFITEKGHEQVAQIYPTLVEVQNKALGGISEEEIFTLKNILTRICENMDDDFKLQI